MANMSLTEASKVARVFSREILPKLRQETGKGECELYASISPIPAPDPSVPLEDQSVESVTLTVFDWTVEEGQPVSDEILGKAKELLMERFPELTLSEVGGSTLRPKALTGATPVNPGGLTI